MNTPYCQFIRASTRLATVALITSGVLHLSAAADVVVLANRTSGAISARFDPVVGQSQQLNLAAGETIPLFVDGKANVSFTSGGNSIRYLLDANCAYFFGGGPRGQVDLQRIGLGEDSTTIDGRSLPGSASAAPTATITVKLLVDEEEPARQVVWERRLRRRIETASEILEKHCRVGLRVVAVDTWNSDNGTNDFVASLSEFEREVRPDPAQLAIGFTSQWTMVTGRTHMAGTRGPLYTHILAREGSPQISEPEKLEFLVHELGHYLGATHSPEGNSVMRPVLGDNLAGRVDFRIQFDPVNTLIMAMMCEEIRRRNIVRVSDLTAGTKLRLRQIYSQLRQAMPKDTSSMHYVQLMSSSAGTPLAEAAKRVLLEIRRAAAANRTLPAAKDGGRQPTRRTGDALTDYYVRHAARAADALPDDVAPRALLVALGVGLDDSNMLARIPGASGLARAIETPEERTSRLAILGEPTMRGRRDLAQHFFVSAYLAAAIGAEAAHAAGIAKELVDSHGSSGFSFADLAADRAGMQFAEGVKSGRFQLNLLAQGFSTEGFLPDTTGLPEGLKATEVGAQYGTANDARFKKMIQEIDSRVRQLVPYRVTNGRVAF
jgi:hypothetical protein